MKLETSFKYETGPVPGPHEIDYGPRIGAIAWRWVRRAGLSAQDGEDCVMIVLEEVEKIYREEHLTGRMTTMVFGTVNEVARNISVSQGRKKCTIRRHEVDFSDAPAALIESLPAPACADPETCLLQRESARVLLELLESLPPRQREACEARFVHREPITEIAARLGCNYYAAAKRIERGRDTIIAKLKEAGLSVDDLLSI